MKNIEKTNIEILKEIKNICLEELSDEDRLPSMKEKLIIEAYNKIIILLKLY